MRQIEKKWEKRLLLSLLLAVFVMTSGRMMQTGHTNTGEVRMESKKPECTEILAWWGTLYPGFCFGEIWETGEEETEAAHPKISFYLAKLFDW